MRKKNLIINDVFYDKHTIKINLTTEKKTLERHALIRRKK